MVGYYYHEEVYNVDWDVDSTYQSQLGLNLQYFKFVHAGIFVLGLLTGYLPTRPRIVENKKHKNGKYADSKEMQGENIGIFLVCFQLEYFSIENY